LQLQQNPIQLLAKRVVKNIGNNLQLEASIKANETNDVNLQSTLFQKCNKE